MLAKEQSKLVLRHLQLASPVRCIEFITVFFTDLFKNKEYYKCISFKVIKNLYANCTIKIKKRVREVGKKGNKCIK